MAQNVYKYIKYIYFYHYTKKNHLYKFNSTDFIGKIKFFYFFKMIKNQKIKLK